MSRIIQVYDEERQINTEVRWINQSADVLSLSTEALTNVRSFWQQSKKHHFKTDILSFFLFFFLNIFVAQKIHFNLIDFLKQKEVVAWNNSLFFHFLFKIQFCTLMILWSLYSSGTGPFFLPPHLHNRLVWHLNSEVGFSFHRHLMRKWCWSRC